MVNKGHSDNDLDLVAHSRSDTECKPSDLVFYIFEHCMTRCLEHSQVSDHVVVGMVLPDDKMIELCFPYHTYDTEIPIIQTPRLRKGLII